MFRTLILSVVLAASLPTLSGAGDLRPHLKDKIVRYGTSNSPYGATEVSVVGCELVLTSWSRMANAGERALTVWGYARVPLTGMRLKPPFKNDTRTLPVEHFFRVEALPRRPEYQLRYGVIEFEAREGLYIEGATAQWFERHLDATREPRMIGDALVGTIEQSVGFRMVGVGLGDQLPRFVESIKDYQLAYCNGEE